MNPQLLLGNKLDMPSLTSTPSIPSNNIDLLRTNPQTNMIKLDEMKSIISK